MRFYATYFGFDPATAQRFEDGTVILRNADGFDSSSSSSSSAVASARRRRAGRAIAFVEVRARAGPGTSPGLGRPGACSGFFADCRPFFSASCSASLVQRPMRRARLTRAAAASIWGWAGRTTALTNGLGVVTVPRPACRGHRRGPISPALAACRARYSSLKPSGSSPPAAYQPAGMTGTRWAPGRAAGDPANDQPDKYGEHNAWCGRAVGRGARRSRLRDEALHVLDPEPEDVMPGPAVGDEQAAGRGGGRLPCYRPPVE